MTEAQLGSQAASQPNNYVRRMLTAAGATVALTVTAVACGEDPRAQSEAVTTGSLLDQATTTTAMPAVAEIPVHTDESLRLSNSKCGGELEVTSTEDFAYKYDFFSASEGNKELGYSYMDKTISDQTWGMGQAAFDVAMEKGLVNATTVASKGDKTTANETLDNYINHVFSTQLPEERTYINGDCRTEENRVTMPSPDIPYLRIGGEKTNNSVEGLVMLASDIEEWKAAAPKDANGNLTFDLVAYQMEINGVMTDVVMIVNAANGCDNIERIGLLTPPTPETTTPVNTTATTEGNTGTTAAPTTAAPTTAPATTAPATTAPATTAPATTAPATTSVATTTTIRSSATIPASTVIQGGGAGGEADPDDNPDNNTSIAPVPETVAPATTEAAPVTTATIPDNGPNGTWNG